MPFTIYSADGAASHVPTVDHAAVSPTGNRVIVFLDDGTTEHLFPLLITRIAVEEPILRAANRPRRRIIQTLFEARGNEKESKDSS